MEEIYEELEYWKEMKLRYEEEADMGRNVERNKWLAEEAQNEIDNLMFELKQ